MMTALAALETGTLPTDTAYCNGRYRLGNNVWHCWSKRGHGNVVEAVHLGGALGASDLDHVAHLAE